MTIKDNTEKEKTGKRLEDEVNKKSSIRLIKEDKNYNYNIQYSDCYDKNLKAIKSDEDKNSNNSMVEKTVVVYGEDKTTELIIQTLNNAKNRWDNYADSQGPTIAMGVEQLRKGMKHAYERGVKIKYLSEITKHNINYCKELMKIARGAPCGQCERRYGSKRK